MVALKLQRRATCKTDDVTRARRERTHRNTPKGTLKIQLNRVIWGSTGQGVIPPERSSTTGQHANLLRRRSRQSTNERDLWTLVQKAPIADRALGIRILGTAGLAQARAAETAHVLDGLLLQILAVTARVLELR